MADWQPIETAPRDGTYVLGCYDNGRGWEYRVVCWTGWQPYPWSEAETEWAEDRVNYWKPLPEPPHE